VAKTVSNRGLNTSANLGTYTPILSNLSFIGILFVPLFEVGFELRCFQLLSMIAWLLSVALPDN